MGIASSWSKGERLDHLDQNRLDGAVYWTEIGFSTYFDIPISSESQNPIFSFPQLLVASYSHVFIFSSPHILIFHQRSGMVGPFRPTPEYEAGYSCFQQVRFANKFSISFYNSKSGTVAFNRWGLKISFPSHFDFQSSGQTPLLQTPSNHHEPPTVPTRNTNGGVISTWWYIGILYFCNFWGVVFVQLVFVYFEVPIWNWTMRGGCRKTS